MKNKRFVAEVLKLNPYFSCIDGFFYFTKVEHLLSGFVCENGSGGFYVWKYAYPLFDRFQRLHLNFGERLKYPDGFIDLNHVAKKDVAIEFSRRISGYIDEVFALQDLEKFLHYLEKDESALRNPKIRKCYAFTLVLVDRCYDAKEQLITVLDSETAKSDKVFYEDCTEVLNLIYSDNNVAKDLITFWGKETKLTLGL